MNPIIGMYVTSLRMFIANSTQVDRCIAQSKLGLASL